METESPRPGADVLRRTSQGQASFPELAEYLKSLPNMVLMSSPKEFARYMEDLETAKKDGMKWAGRSQNLKAMIRKTAGCQAARLFCPESLHGLYSREEMDS